MQILYPLIDISIRFILLHVFFITNDLFQLSLSVAYLCYELGLL